MSEPFLILHKVRGEPAFDIAERIRCPRCNGIGGFQVVDFETGASHDYEGAPCDECDGQGFWWIIPTSGHRAHPYWHVPLSDIWIDTHHNPHAFVGDPLENIVPTLIPESLPDHFEATAAPKGRGVVTNLLNVLGLVKTPDIERRF